MTIDDFLSKMKVEGLSDDEAMKIASEFEQGEDYLNLSEPPDKPIAKDDIVALYKEGSMSKEDFEYEFYGPQED